MKRSLFAIATVLLLALTFCAEAAAATFHKSADYARVCLASCTDFALKVFTGPAPMLEPIDALPQSRMLQARAFLGRLVKRDRPVVSATWRMCPSI